MSKTTKKPVLLRRTLAAASARVFVAFLIFASIISVISITRTGDRVAHAAAPTTLNFQARLLSSTGTLVPDGDYNIDFKLYDHATNGAQAQGTCSGNCLWEETRTGGNKIQVKNGYLSAYLGDVTSLPTDIWNQQLWLTMNIGGTGAASWDGEMTPRIRLTSVPYAFRATVANSAETLVKDTGSYNGTVDFSTLTADRTFLFPDTSLATTGSPGTICVYNGASSNCPAASGSAYYIQNDTVLQTAANFNIQARDSTTNGTVGGVFRGAAGGQTVDLLQFQATAGTVLAAVTAAGNLQVASLIDTRAAGTLSIGTTNATAISLDQNTTVAATKTFTVTSGATSLTGATSGDALTVSNSTSTGNILTLKDNSTNVLTVADGGATTLQNSTNSSSALAVKNAAGDEIFRVDSTGESGNLISNGSVEQNTTNWDVHGASTVTRVTTPVYYGVGSLSVATTAAANDGAKYNVTLSASTEYTASFYAKLASGTFTNMRFGYSDDGTTGAEVDCKTNQTIVTTGWTLFNCTFTTGGSISGTPYFYIEQASATSRTFYVDGFHLIAGQNIGAYYNGSVNSSLIFNQIAVQNSEDSNTALQVQASNGTSVLAVDTINKRVGIGTNSPNARLHVATITSSSIGFIIKGVSSQSGDLMQLVDSNNTTLTRFDASGNLQLASSLDTFTATGLSIGTTNATSLSVSKAGATTTVNGALTVTEATTLNAGVTSTGGAVSLTGNAASSLTTSSGALTLTSAAAATWSTTAGDLTIQGGSGTVSLGTSTALTAAGALSITSGGANALTLDAGGAAAVNLGTANATSVSISRTGVTTTVNGALTVTEAGTFSSTLGATGLATLSGGLNITSGGNLAVQRNTTDITTTGTLDDLNLGSGGLFRFSGASAQTVTSIANPADGRIVTLINAAATDLTIQNDSGGTASNRIVTGTGSNLTVPTGASVMLTYDSSASRWRVIGSVASTGGTGANQALSNLSGVAINTSLLTGADNTIDLGSATYSWRTLYADTSVLTPTVDTAAAGTLTIGGTATAITLADNVTVAAGMSLTLAGGNTASRPGSPTEGMLYFDTDTDQLITYANGKWQADRSTATKIVAASNSSQALKDSADYVADGTADEVEINAALTAASGGKVYLAEGTYVAAATVVIPNNTSLMGAGNGTVIELGNLDATENLIENSDTSTGTGVVIRDLKLDGRSDLNTAGIQYGIYFNGMGGGLGTSARPGGKLSSVNLTRFRSGNLYLTASGNGSYTNIQTMSSGGAGISVMASSNHNTFSAITAQGNTGNGITIDTSGYTSVSNIVTQGNTGAGVRVNSSDYVSVSGSVMRQNSGNGIEVNSSDYNTISGNAIYSSGADGINAATGTGNIYTGNSVYNSTGDGFDIANTLSTVTGNTAISNVNGFVISNNNQTVTGNVSRQNSSYGIYVNASDNSSISSNNVTSNTTYGIYLNSSDNNSVSDNRIADNGGASNNNGIYIATSDTNSITDNTITDTSATTNYAINIVATGTPTGNRLSGNSLSTGTISDLGTSTMYGGQSNGTSYLLQPNDDFSITGNAASTIATTSGNLTLQGGSGTVSLGTSTALTAAGALSITSGGANALSIDAGGAAAVNVGDTNATSVSVCNSANCDTISIGTNTDADAINVGDATDTVTILGAVNIATSAASQNVIVGNSTGGTIRVGQNGGTLQLDGTNFDVATTGVVTLAGGQTADITTAAASTATAITIKPGNSTGSDVAGAILTLQGGNATVGNANGGNLVLGGGTGVGTGAKGLVVVDTATFSAATTQAFTGSGSITQSNIDGFGTIRISSDAAGYTATLSDPTNTTAGRVVYVTNTGSYDMTLSVNGGGTGNTITLKPSTTATMVWNGSDWTAAGASSSTDLQAAYNNTATSAGGAELILNASGGAADGLTIRNNGTSPIVGGILEVQSSIGSNLLSVNNNSTEYAVNGGAETSTNFSTNWTSTTGGTITQSNDATYFATGQYAVKTVTAATANQGAKNVLSTALTTGMTYSVSFAVKGTTNFTTLQVLYSPDGTTSGTTTCATGKTVTTGVWTRILCTFTAAGTINSSNAILIRQTDAVAHTWYVDNLSVSVNANMTFAADGSVDSALGTNWTQYDADGGAGTTTVSRSTTTIYDTTGSVSDVTSAHANEGMRNNMPVTPVAGTQYLVSFYAQSSNTFNDITVGFLAGGGSGAPTSTCTDYNTQSVSTSSWTKITCLITASGTITDPDIVIYQPTATARTFYVDALTITLNNNNSNNVQIGGANKGGPTTLLTLDRASSAPIAANNDAYLGSMYYDTTTGRIQCYEADGWGACGSSPDNIIVLTPEYTGAVLNGSGVGTMTADFCSNESGVLSVGSLCANHEARNYYRWTSPQATSQTYSIYVTYKLPSTFKAWNDSNTIKLTALTDSTSNASATIQAFKKESDSSAIVSCGSATTINSSASTWQTTNFGGDETACGFGASDVVIFKIDMAARSNANIYVENLEFTFTNN